MKISLGEISLAMGRSFGALVTVQDPAVIKMPALKPGEWNVFSYVDEKMKVDYMVLYCHEM